MKNLFALILLLSVHLSARSNCFLSSTYDCSTNSYVFSYSGPVTTDITWDFDDGSSNVTAAYNQTVSHQFTSSGLYSVSISYIEGGVTQTYSCSSSLHYAASNTSYLGSATFTILPSGTPGGYNVSYTGSSIPAVSGGMYAFWIDYGDGTFDMPSFYNQAVAPGVISSHTYNNSSTQSYNITIEFRYLEPDNTYIKCEYTYEIEVEVNPNACCSNFEPLATERYWLSAWVLEDHPNQVKTYENAFVELEFVGGGASIQLLPSGDIIEGWQRIVGDFVIPTGTTNLRIHLVNDNTTINAYFDDVRVHPFNASMKSYVYDPVTLWLTAELDDNNYATFYEYDQEGQLIRIKKETARGVMTIQESRSNNPKDQ